MLKTRAEKDFWGYFEHEVEYPDLLSGEVLPYGTCYEYVSSTFLNGFINYVKPIALYVLDRYTLPEETIQAGGSKGELLNKVKDGTYNPFHTDLRALEDDVLILAKPGKGGDGYVFFWYDCDVSDCIIGRFKTDDPEEVVITQLKDWLESEKSNAEGYGSVVIDYHELPLSFFNGWVSF